MAGEGFPWRLTRYRQILFFVITILLVIGYYFIVSKQNNGQGLDWGRENEKICKPLPPIFIVSIFLIIWVNRLNASEGYTGENTITVFNWGDYIDMDLIEQFEEETGITVIYETFDSNEAMLTKIQQGGTSYDVAVPSEYTVEQMKEEGLLHPLDHEKTP